MRQTASSALLIFSLSKLSPTLSGSVVRTASVSTRRLPWTVIFEITPVSGTGCAASAAVSPVGTEGASPCCCCCSPVCPGCCAGAVCCASAAAAVSVRVARKEAVRMGAKARTLLEFLWCDNGKAQGRGETKSRAGARGEGFCKRPAHGAGGHARRSGMSALPELAANSERQARLAPRLGSLVRHGNPRQLLRICLDQRLRRLHPLAGHLRFEHQRVGHRLAGEVVVVHDVDVGDVGLLRQRLRPLRPGLQLGGRVEIIVPLVAPRGL